MSAVPVVIHVHVFTAKARGREPLGHDGEGELDVDLVAAGVLPDVLHEHIWHLEQVELDPDPHAGSISILGRHGDLKNA
jgi:hypothetical protein